MRRAALSLAALLAVAALVFNAPAASAAAAVTVRQIDTTAWPTVRMVVLTSGQESSTAFNVRDGGRLVPELRVLPVSQSATRLGTVLAIDTSASMAGGGRIEAAKAAAHQFVNQALPTEQVAVLVFGQAPRELTAFTNNHTVLGAAIDGVQAHGETALWDGVKMAASLLQAEPDLQPNIVVISDGHDTTSVASAADARGAVAAAKAAVFSVSVGNGADGAGLAALSDANGGRYVAAASSADLARSYGALQASLQGQYELTYSAVGHDPRDVTVSVGAEQVTASIVPGAMSLGSNARPEHVALTSAPGFLSGVLGKALIVLMALAAAGAMAWAIGMTVMKPRSELSAFLEPYEADETSRLRDSGKTPSGFGDLELVRRAVDFGARFEVSRALVSWVESRLDQANVPMRPAEVLLAFSGVTAVAALVVIVVAGPLMGLATVLALALAGLSVLSLLARRRRRKFIRQLPDALKLLSGTLRAGYSLMQGVETMAGEIGAPMGDEMKRVLAEARLGRGLDEALADMAGRLNSPDFDWTVMAIGIQREVGGNLAELLDTVAETMQARERLRRDVKSLTAEGRMSAIVIGILPIGLAGVMFVINPTYMNPLLHTSLGRMMAIGSGVLALVGFYWMKKTVEIEI